MRSVYRGPLTLVCWILALGMLVSALPVSAPAAAPSKARPTILDFGRGLCPNCKQMEGILEKIKERYGDQVDVRLVYVDQDEALFKQYRIMLVPTQVFLDASGKEVFRHTGVFPPDLLEKKLRELKFIKNQGS
jgi:thioredoxin 1